MTYTVKKGDSLSAIAQRELGSASRWPELYELNRNTLQSGNPDLIYPGEVLMLPAEEPEPVVDRKAEDDRVRLYVADQIFTDWLQVSVKRSIDQATATFELEATAPITGPAPAWFFLEEDAKCVVTIGGQPVVTGYIDSVEPAINASRYANRIAGRDLTQDLVDCSAKGGPQWRGSDVADIARDICRPYAIKVRSDIDTGGPVRLHRIQQGESGYDSLERIARERGFVISSDPDGHLRLLRSDEPRRKSYTLRLRDRILEISRPRSTRERFSEITVKGNNGAKGTATDSRLRRYRNKTEALGEKSLNEADARRRAAWEVKVRAARADSVSIKFAGWLDPDNELWAVNTVVTVDAPELQLQNAELLITDVEFSLDSNGQFAALTLRRPDAFVAEPGKAA